MFLPRSAVLTGLPNHQNGMYGLHHLPNNFNSFSNVESLPEMIKPHNIRTGQFSPFQFHVRKTGNLMSTVIIVHYHFRELYIIK